MITEEDVEKAVHFISDSAEQYAKWRAAERYYEQHLKRVEALEFNKIKVGAVETKKMAARASEAYEQCLEDYKKSKENAEYLSVKIEAARLTISCYQSMIKQRSGGY